MKVKVKIKVGDQVQEHEVDLDDAVYMTREQHNTALEAVVTDRLARQDRSLRTKLVDDKAFQGEVLKKLNIDPENPGKGQPLDAAQAERLTADIRNREVVPLQQKLEVATGSLTKLQRTTIEAQLTAELIDKGIDKTKAPRLAQLEASRFEFDEITGTFALKDGDKFVVSTKATQQAPYKGIAEYAEEYAGAKENSIFRSQAEEGPGVKKAPGSNSTTVTKRSDFKSDAEKVAWITQHGHEAFGKLPQ